MVGVVGFSIVITIFKRWKHLFGALQDLKAMKFMTLGSFTGPFLGVSFSLLAVQHTGTGIAATLMALTPVMIIPAAIMMKKEKVSAIELHRCPYIGGRGGPFLSFNQAQAIISDTFSLWWIRLLSLGVHMQKVGE